jgi:hypothetical protein
MVNARPHDPDTTKALNINVLPLCANSCGEPDCFQQIPVFGQDPLHFLYPYPPFRAILLRVNLVFSFLLFSR